MKQDNCCESKLFGAPENLTTPKFVIHEKLTCSDSNELRTFLLLKRNHNFVELNLDS